MKINFDYLDDSIVLEKGRATILVVENSQIYSKIIFSLYNKEDYVKIYDESYCILNEKDLILVLNPLLYDFQERNTKSMIYSYVAKQVLIDDGFAEEIACDYQKLANKILNFIETTGEIEFEYKEEHEIKELLKMIGLSINQSEVKTIFDKIQLLINVVNEIGNNKLLIFTNLNLFMSEKEYELLLEDIELKGITVLIIEGIQKNLENFHYYLLDKDFCLNKI